MHRFYVPPEDSRDDFLALTGNEAHHATRVLRIREGERVTALNGIGGEYGCAVGTAKGKTVSLRILERRKAPPRSCAVTLLQAIPKGKIIESIIQKATELGAARIVPILSERVVTHLDSQSAESKREKWQQVAIEAIKQCGQPWLPRVEAPMSLAAWLARQERCDLALVGCLESGSRHPHLWFEEFSRENHRVPKSVAVWVGPEGDFTSAEYRAIQQSGARPMTLGPLVLRVETAAMYSLSVVHHELTAQL
jgi:16S rRNA (uracil1498-N3)-methyltransferase